MVKKTSIFRISSLKYSSLPQEKATKWKNPDGHMDGLTTNGVLVMHPEGFPEDPKQGLWREISVCGDVYALRETRSGPSRGKLVSYVLANMFTHRRFGRSVK